MYKCTDIFMFREVWALEKVHGTSAHVRFAPRDGFVDVSFFSGDSKYAEFVKLFDPGVLEAAYLADDRLNDSHVIVYGEAYGGKLQGMKATYGEQLRFVAFDVSVGDLWLDVPDAHDVCKRLGFEFVDYRLVPCTKEALDAERDRESVQAIRNGCGPGKLREGVVLRPPKELCRKNGSRIIAKHRRREFSETKQPREITPEALAVLQDAQAIAEEWVTEERLTHVLDKLAGSQQLAGDGPFPWELGNTGDVCRAMLEDVKREGAGEIVWTKAAERSVGTAAAKLFKRRVTQLPVTP